MKHRDTKRRTTWEPDGAQQNPTQGIGTTQDLVADAPILAPTHDELEINLAAIGVLDDLEARFGPVAAGQVVARMIQIVGERSRRRLGDAIAREAAAGGLLDRDDERAWVRSRRGAS